MNCKYCNNEFEPTSVCNVFCSRICGKRENRNKITNTNVIVRERNCLVCNTLISLQARADKILCSKRCKEKHSDKTQTKKEVIAEMLNEAYVTQDEGIKTIYASGTDNNIKILVDANLYNWLNSYKWYCTNDYPQHKNIPLHKILKHLWGWGDKICDHKDRNRLNNTQDNLRSVTSQQNNCNRGPIKGSKVPYKGVHTSRSGKYQAIIGYNRKQYNLGSFNTAEEAALEYNKAALLHHGEFAYLNVIN